MDAGLLKMNNFIGECVSDIRVQIKTLDTKINEIGNRLPSLSLELTQIREQSLLTTTQALQKEKQKEEVLNEMKALMAQQMKEMKELHEQYQSGLSSLLAQNVKLTTELSALKEVKSLDLEEIRNLRIDNMIFREMVERLGGKIEKVIDRLAEEEVEAEEEEDAFMQIFWPQGDGRLEIEGLNQGCEKNMGGVKGKQRSGWCSVM